MSGATTLREVTLATDSSSLPDFLTPWIDQYNIASQNATQLLNTFYDAPGIGLQQLVANMSGYLQDFFNDPTSSTITTVSQEMQANLAAVLSGFTLQNATSETTNTVTQHTIDGLVVGGGLAGGHAFLFNNIPAYSPPDQQAVISEVFNFLASPDSGLIMGALGPEISPWVALFNSVSAGDDWNTTLANMVGAYFNGADLNLDSLNPLINGSGFLPAGMEVKSLDLAFGGLLTPGSVGGSYGGGVGGSVGGSILNSLGIFVSGVPALNYRDIPSQAVGPLGAFEGWAQAIGSLLGWDGSGSPLAGVTLPTIPTDFFDGGTAAADASTWLQDLFAAF